MSQQVAPILLKSFHSQYRKVLRDLPDQRVLMAPPDHRDRPDLRGQMETMEPRVLPDQQDPQQGSEHPPPQQDQLESWLPVLTRPRFSSSQYLPEPQDRQGLRVLMALPDQQGLRDRQDLPDPQVMTEIQDPQDLPEPQVQPVHPDQRDLPEEQDPQAPQDLPVMTVQMREYHYRAYSTRASRLHTAKVT